MTGQGGKNTAVPKHNLTVPRERVGGPSHHSARLKVREKTREEGSRKPLNKLTDCTVSHARKLSKRLQKIQKEESSSDCGKNANTETEDYHDLVVGDIGEQHSKDTGEEGDRREHDGTFEDSFPKSPSGRFTKYLSGNLFQFHYLGLTESFKYTLLELPLVGLPMQIIPLRKLKFSPC